MATAGEIVDFLSKFPIDMEVVIYPKYSHDEFDGFKKHTFRIDQVCEQYPYAMGLKDDPERLKEYFGDTPYKDFEVNKHIAILV